MHETDLTKECEVFRQSVMLSINSLNITQRQKQKFLLVFQGFYLQLLNTLTADAVSEEADSE